MDCPVLTHSSRTKVGYRTLCKEFGSVLFSGGLKDFGEASATECTISAHPHDVCASGASQAVLASGTARRRESCSMYTFAKKLTG